MIKKGKVYYKTFFAGIIEENEDGYFFSYDKDYLNNSASKPVSLTIPFRQEPYHSKTMFPFFDGLIPEGWLLNIVEANWKINPRDRMSLLLTFCRDCIGAVSIIPLDDEKELKHE